MKGGFLLKKIILILLIITSVFLALSCSAYSDGEAQNLPYAEVKQYEGKDLSSIADFRENSIAGPQHVDIGTYKLEVTGLVDKPVSLTYDDVLKAQHYKKVVTLNCVEGWSVDILWEGVKVTDIIDQAGVQDGANTVIFYAVDGYTTSLPLDFIRTGDILMAHKMNDVVLPPERGYPFELVAQDKLGYKWIKWISKIELSNDPDYRGYWESRGFTNEADV
jgi:DMSO/TMAO reductase YedYZ molybdopterin-dependent catalytic subunit